MVWVMCISHCKLGRELGSQQQIGQRDQSNTWGWCCERLAHTGLGSLDRGHFVFFFLMMVSVYILTRLSENQHEFFKELKCG